MSHSFFTTGIINAISISRHSSARTLFLFVPLAGPVPFLTLRASSRRLSPSVSLESSNPGEYSFPRAGFAQRVRLHWSLVPFVDAGPAQREQRARFSLSLSLRVSSAKIIFRDASTVADYPLVKTYILVYRSCFVFRGLGVFSVFFFTRLRGSVSSAD